MPGAKPAFCSGSSSVCVPGEAHGHSAAAKEGISGETKNSDSSLTPVGLISLHKYASGTATYLRRARVSIQVAKAYQSTGYGAEALR
ncbi:uncharacterized protein PG986_003621 [Apiospora aurea]|uniref:N-acetyltransferase domain-containing protein n=1 Tax=Apiospora aurea TaxID=335848 RepID=A0ABR1QS78_9PEZI